MKMTRGGLMFAAIAITASIFSLLDGRVQAEESGGTVVLDTSGYWRVHHTYAPAVVRSAEGLRELKTLTGKTAPPAPQWAEADFDDGEWARVAGRPLPVQLPYGMPLELADAGYTMFDRSSPSQAMVCVRGKFRVTDPAAVKGLKLRVAYRGGAVVYLNGKEIARGHLAKDAKDGLADDYPADAFLRADGSAQGGPYVQKDLKEAESQKRWLSRVREIRDVAIEPAMLRAGVNTLAIEVRRAAYPEAYVAAVPTGHTYLGSLVWSTCGLAGVRLEAAGPGGVEPNVVRPQAVQVWNSSQLTADTDMDWGDRCDPLRAVKLAGTRGGMVSGKVVVGSDKPLAKLVATASDLTGPAGKVPASAVRIRYGLPWSTERSLVRGRHPAEATPVDALWLSAPEEIPVRAAKPLGAPYVMPGQPTYVFGAVASVWATVAVPADAVAGEYKGMIRINAAGLETPVEVPVELKVSGWQCPPPQQFNTIVDLIQSPESVALQYGVPLYSEKHWTLIESSLRQLGYVGNWTLYVPLICRTNQGNEQSMVRWVKKGDAWEFDFAVLDRYLDLAEKHMGKPRVLCLYVWDLHIGGIKSRHQNEKVGGVDLAPSEVKVSQLDPASGNITELTLGGYDEKTQADWQRLAAALMERLKKRGIDGAVQLGLGSDGRPSPDIVEFWGKVLPKVPWMREGHIEWKEFGTTGASVDFQANVVPVKFLEDPANGKYSCFGWRRPDKRVMYFRSGEMPPTTVARLLAELNVMGNQRGFGRIGLDFWPVLADAKGAKTGHLIGRYPASAWRQLDWMARAAVPPGPDGAMGSSRLEQMREGLQQAEARISLERTLLDEKLRGKLGAALAGRAQKALDERARNLMPFLEYQQAAGFTRQVVIHMNGAEFGFSFDADRPQLFYQWYESSGWRQRDSELFDVAGEAAAALAK